MRALVLIGVLAGLLVAAAGCGSDEPSLCGSLEDLQSSVQQLQEVELEEGAVDDLRSAADEIEGNVAAVRDAAGEQLGDEAAELEDSARALAAELEAATEGEVTAETRQALLDSASRAVAAFDALREAAPECDL